MTPMIFQHQELKDSKFRISKAANPSYPPFAKGGTFSDHHLTGSPLCKGGLGGILNVINDARLDNIK